jgi:pyrroloquinoline quinone biosynthesis protein D
MTEQSIGPDTVPKIAPMFRFQWEEAQGCHVLLYPEGMVKLSGSAGEIMKRIDGKSPVAALLAELRAAFPGADLETDVYKFLEAAYDRGWLRTASAR